MSADPGLRLPGPSLHAVPSRVGIVAEDELARRRTAEALERDGFEVAAQAAHPGELLTSDATTSATAVVVAFGEIGPVQEWLDQLREGLPEIPVIVVATSFGSRAIRDALRSGASAFVADDRLEERLGAAVRAVCAGLLALPREFRDVVEPPILSPRERQVLSMVVLGCTNGEIANKLYVAETTVKSHLSSAYRKLGVRSRHEATALILNSTDGLGVGILAISESGWSTSKGRR